jgi:sugar lactone lactonase YvrE
MRAFPALMLLSLAACSGKGAEIPGTLPQASLRSSQTLNVTQFGQTLVPILSTTALNAYGIALNAAGDIYVSQGTAVFKITPGGALSSTTIRYRYLKGIATDSSGNVYAGAQSDFPHHPGGLFEIAPDGKVSDLTVSQFYGSNDEGVAVDSSGNVYVATDDPYGYAGPIYKRSPHGKITTIGATFASNAYLLGIAVDRLGNLYVADVNNGVIDKIPPHARTITVGSGFSGPSDVAVDKTGDVYIADTNNKALKRIAPDGSVRTITNQLYDPLGVAVDGSGSIYVADGSSGVKKVAPDGTITALGYAPPSGVAANTKYVYVADPGSNSVFKIAKGQITSIGSGFHGPSGAAVDKFGNVYVADTDNGAVKKIATDGKTRTVASGFRQPYAIAVDRSLTVYVADQSAGTVDKIAPNGTVTRIRRRLKYPHGIAVDSAGNVYVALMSHHIVKIAPNGAIARVGSFGYPSAVAVDMRGNLYVADSLRSLVCKISPNDEKVGIASVAQVNGVAVDASDHIYVTSPAGAYKIHQLPRVDSTQASSGCSR